MSSVVFGLKRIQSGKFANLLGFASLSKYRASAIFAISLVVVLLTQQSIPLPACAESTSLPQLMEEPNDSAVDYKTNGGEVVKKTISIDADLLAVADTIKVSGSLKRVQSLKLQLKALGAASTIDRLTIRQDLLETQESIMRSLFKANLQVDYLIARIDGESNRFSQVLQDLTGKRDKDVMTNAIVTQLMNGALWALSCSYTLASTHHASYSYADGWVGIVAGIVPSLVSLYGLYQLQGPKRYLQADPNVLNPIFGPAQAAAIDYPAVVKAYLDEHSTNQAIGPTRKQRLLQSWIDKDYLPQPTKRTFTPQEEILAGTASKRAALTVKMLQTRLLMLTDLRCEILQMKKQLLDLTELID